jgi:hypothetical protein
MLEPLDFEDGANLVRDESAESVPDLFHEITRRLCAGNDMGN